MDGIEQEMSGRIVTICGLNQYLGEIKRRNVMQPKNAPALVVFAEMLGLGEESSGGFCGAMHHSEEMLP